MTRMIPIDEDALFALARIAEHRRTPIASDAQARAVREECRTYAVEVVNAIFRAAPELSEGKGTIER